MKQKKMQKKKPIDFYLQTYSTIKEERNDVGEYTYFIDGEYSLDGKPWKKCIVIWKEP